MSAFLDTNILVYAQEIGPKAETAQSLVAEGGVISVQVLNEPGKMRRFGGRIGRTQDWKKAYVRLAAGQTIDYEAKARA